MNVIICININSILIISRKTSKNKQVYNLFISCYAFRSCEYTLCSCNTESQQWFYVGNNMNGWVAGR